MQNLAKFEKKTSFLLKIFCETVFFSKYKVFMLHKVKIEGLIEILCEFWIEKDFKSI